MMCVVDVELPDGNLSDALDAAGSFAFRTRSIARFARGGATYRVWYDEDWRATREDSSGIERVGRDHGRWGRFESPEDRVSPPEVEGDPSTWHIRLDQRINIPGQGCIENWSLFKGDKRESSPTTKSDAQRWRDRELESA